MLSMIMVESMKYSITLDQLADLNALDMIIRLRSPSMPLHMSVIFMPAWLVRAAIRHYCSFADHRVLGLHFIERYRNSRIMNSVLEESSLLRSV